MLRTRACVGMHEYTRGERRGAPSNIIVHTQRLKNVRTARTLVLRTETVNNSVRMYKLKYVPYFKLQNPTYRQCSRTVVEQYHRCTDNNTMRAASLLLTLACAAAYRCIQRPVCRLDLSVTDRASSSQESSASDRARGAIRSTVRAVVSLAAPLLLFGLGSSPSPVLAEDSSLVVVLGSGGKTGALVLVLETLVGTLDARV